MTRLVDDLLEVGRVTGGKIRLEREPLDLRHGGGAVIDTWRSGDRFPHHEVHSDLREVWVHADRARIEQVVANLLDNALKYTPARGRIDVRVRPEGGAAVVGCATPARACRRAARARLRPVRPGRAQPRPRRGGLGIGLTWSRRLVEMHGGTIRGGERGPRPGQRRSRSACPRSSGRPPRRPARRRATADAAPRRTPRILVVEDNADARESLARAAAAAAATRCATAENGEQGLAMARAGRRRDRRCSTSACPASTATRSRAGSRAEPATRHLWLVALTGYGTQEDRKRALAAGFDEHLVKPVEPDELEALLRHAAGRAGEAAGSSSRPRVSPSAPACRR